jgi:hypothetical protein
MGISMINGNTRNLANFVVGGIRQLSSDMAFL